MRQLKSQSQHSSREHTSRERTPGSTVFVEVIRLCVVVLATVASFRVADSVESVQVAGDTTQLLVVALGVGVGYVVGGVFGRFTIGRIDATERRLRGISAGDLLATVIGGASGLTLGAAVTWPALLLDAKTFTLPLAALILAVSTATGMRIGIARGGDLLRFVGASGRLPVTTPSSGARTKVVDTSVLIDGRIVDVCRAGFLDGTLVVPRVVLYELQGLADAEEPERHLRGRRGLDVLGALQRASGVALEVTDEDHPDVRDVDAKLVAMAKARGAALLTVDGNLGRVAEVQGVKVLNLHGLAETLRPPVLPGDTLDVLLVKPGREAGQGVGYLADGTMVVVEGGRERQGSTVSAEVTSILSNPNGRMVFATARPSRTVPLRQVTARA